MEDKKKGKPACAKPVKVEGQSAKEKKFNAKDMIIYSAIMNPKFDE